MRNEFISQSADDTVGMGRNLAARLTPPVLVMLSGELGTGKTTLTKGIVSGLGAGSEEEVTSPTFTLVHVFHDHCKVYHVDLYRVEDFHDLETLALEDVLTEPAVMIVEWAERMTLRTGWPEIYVHLEHLDGDTRRITISDSREEAAGPISTLPAKESN